MIDGSHYPFEQNVKLVKSVVDFATSTTVASRLSKPSGAAWKMT